jgi:outer membrane protein TolC
MGKLHQTLQTILGAAALLLLAPGLLDAQESWRLVFPEQRHIEIRDPSRLPAARLPSLPPPPTVSSPQNDLPPRNLSLDDAIHIALANCRAIRVLAGQSVVPSGSTIYDPAVSNTGIDQARARFDPAVEVQNQFRRRAIPEGVFDPAQPGRVLIEGPRVDDYNMGLGLTKTTITGGTASLDVNTNPTRSQAAGLPLSPQTPTSVGLGYTQPLLQGGGAAANLAPIVIARINTQRSFFQMKDSVQQLVGGVIEAYWALVAARTDLWARQQQVAQGQEALDRAEAILAVGLGNVADVAQSRAALANFKALLIAAKAAMLQREAALRNILGLPPSDATRIVPVTPPAEGRLDPDWEGIVQLAAERRPDLIELKLIIEADQQQLLLARNQALPRVDAGALYRWNGLEGFTPDRTRVSGGPGQFYEWQLGVNFSVPLGLRGERAKLRQQELVIMRDRANLEEGLHNAVHLLAGNCRNLGQFYEQYAAYQDSREAARINLERQLADYQTGRGTLYFNVLQAITDWGNAVGAEAQALTQYNAELGNLERQTGTILETHGIRFAEERYGSMGPLGRLLAERCYPQDMPPGPNAPRYQSGDQPAEHSFDLSNPVMQDEEVPAPAPAPAPPPD